MTDFSTRRRVDIEPDPSRYPLGVWRAVVTRVDSGSVWVEVPRYLAGFEFGPCPVLQGFPALEGFTDDAVADHTHAGGGGAAAGAHSHTITGVELTQGDTVLVLFVEGRSDEVVVLGRIV